MEPFADARGEQRIVKEYPGFIEDQQRRSSVEPLFETVEQVGHPEIALRLMVAHVIAGSPLWTIRIEQQTTRNEDVRASVETCKGEADFDERRCAVLGICFPR